ncbi:hypothetical protein LXL04_010548 [Taraxacum kok-saghyz]
MLYQEMSFIPRVRGFKFCWRHRSRVSVCHVRKFGNTSLPVRRPEVALDFATDPETSLPDTHANWFRPAMGTSGKRHRLPTSCFSRTIWPPSLSAPLPRLGQTRND